jgi:MFS transporter, DHA1 family, tetracycline resistance protein
MDSVGFGIIIPVLPDLIMQISGEDIAAAARYGGWLMFVYAFMQFFFAPILGNLSDAYGRRPVLLLSMLVLGINYIIMGFADSLLLLFAGRIISGIGASTLSTCNAYIADVTPAEKRAQYFGLMGAAFGMGFIIGPVIGGLLGEFGPRTPFFAAAGLLFLGLIFGFLILPESLKNRDRRKFELIRANPFATFMQLRKFKVVFGLLGVVCILNLGHHVMPAIWSYYTIERFNWSTREIGYSLGFAGTMIVIVQGLLISIVIRKVGMRWTGVIGLTASIISFLGYATANASWMLYVAMIPGALGGLASPAMNGIASGQVGSTQQGELQGGMASIMSFTSILSPPIMTQTFALFSSQNAVIYFPGAPFLLASLLVVFALMLFIKTTANLTITDQTGET